MLAVTVDYVSYKIIYGLHPSLIPRGLTPLRQSRLVSRFKTFRVSFKGFVNMVEVEVKTPRQNVADGAFYGAGGATQPKDIAL